MSETIIPSPLNPAGQPAGDDAAIGKARIVLVDTLNWLERLNANPDVERFLAFVRQGAEATRTQAENISQHDATKRDAYAQRHFGLAGIAEWPAKSLESARNALLALDKRQQQ